MKRLYLHIGLPKTGTSYLQSWLNINNALLRKEGVWIPTKPIYSHRLAVEYITDAQRSAKRDIVHIRQTSIGEVERDITAALSSQNYSTGIISSEYFFECSPVDLHPLIERFRGVEIVIILFLRRQDRMIESGYNQEVKAMGQRASLSPPQYSDRLDWLNLFHRWSSIFGESNVRIANYDVAAKNKTLLSEFCDLVGCSTQILQETDVVQQAQNESLPANLLEFKRLANAVDFPNLQHWLLELVQAGFSGPAFRLSPDVARQYLAFYAESNSELQRLLNLKGAGATLFPAYEVDQDISGADLTDKLPMETIVRLLTEHIRQEQEKSKEFSYRIENIEKQISVPKI